MSERASIVRETLLSQIESGLVKDSLVISPDSRHIAYVTIRNDDTFLIEDGIARGPYRRVSLPRFSPDSRRLAYSVLSGQWRVVVDGIIGNDSDMAADPVFSPDSRQVCYEAKRDDKWLLVTNHKAEAAHGAPYGQGTFVSFGTAAMRSDFVKENDEREWQGPIHFSPDSTRLAYTTSIANKSCVLVDGKKGKLYDGILAHSVRFSPDSKHIGYTVLDNNKIYAVVDGKDGKRYDSVSSWGPVFSPDSKHVAYLAFLRDKSFMVIDSHEEMPHDQAGSLKFSPDSKRVAYVVTDNRECFVVVDGMPGKHYNNVGGAGLTFSPSSARIAYQAATSEKACIVLDEHEGDPYSEVFPPVFSPDGNMFAYSAKRGEQYLMVINGNASDPYDWVGGPTFGPENSHPRRMSIGVDSTGGLTVRSPATCRLAYRAVSNNWWFVVVDGEKGPNYDWIPLSVDFDSNDSVHYLAQKGDKMYYVEETLQ